MEPGQRSSQTHAKVCFSINQSLGFQFQFPIFTFLPLETIQKRPFLCPPAAIPLLVDSSPSLIAMRASSGVAWWILNLPPFAFVQQVNHTLSPVPFQTSLAHLPFPSALAPSSATKLASAAWAQLPISAPPASIPQMSWS